MAVRTIYSNGPAYAGRPTLNKSGCAVSLGTGTDGLIAFAVYGYKTQEELEYGGAAFALVDRTEARAIWEALGRELANG